jgi:hypothetical protein
VPAAKKVAWVSSVYGGYDAPAAPAPQDHDAEYVLVTDRPYDCPPWRVVVEPRPQLHPRLAAKYAKCRPDAYADADVYIWTDANVRVTDPQFIRWCLLNLGDAPIGIPRHPDAPAITGDLELSMVQPRYSSLPMREQVAHYVLREGFPPGYGNWWTGLVVRQGMPPEFGDAWMGEMTRWVYHDQISLPYLLWKHGIRPADLPQGWLEGRFGFSVHGPEASVRVGTGA